MIGVPGRFGRPEGRELSTKKNGRGWITIEMVILWTGMLWALPSRGGSGIILVVFASLLGTAALPLEYAAVAATAPALLPTIFDTLPPWYMGTFRWIFLFAASAILMLRCVSTRTSRSGGARGPFVVLLTSFVVVAAFSGLTSVSPSLSLLKWCVLIWALISAGAIGTKMVEIYGGMAARKWVRAWIACSSPVLVINILALLTGLGGEVFAQGAFRGLSGNSNSLGVMLAVVLPLLLCSFIYSKTKPDNLGWVLLMLTLGSGFLLTQSWSRASIAGFGGGLLTVWWIHPRNRLTRYASVAGLAVLILMVSSAQLGDRFEYWVYKGKEHDSLMAARTEQWRRGIEAFQQSPLLGAGFGVTSLREEAWSLESFETLRAEQGSSLFAILGQTGLLGAVPFYAAILIVLIGSTRFARAVKDPWLTGIVSSCWVAFFNSFFEGWMAAPSSGLFWFMIFQLFFLDAVTKQFRMPRRAVFRAQSALAGASPRFGSVVGTTAVRGTAGTLR
jgi:O-antigen ligase